VVSPYIASSLYFGFTAANADFKLFKAACSARDSSAFFFLALAKLFTAVCAAISASVLDCSADSANFTAVVYFSVAADSFSYATTEASMAFVSNPLTTASAALFLLEALATFSLLAEIAFSPFPEEMASSSSFCAFVNAWVAYCYSYNASIIALCLATSLSAEVTLPL
jgi:hypothetical protein